MRRLQSADFRALAAVAAVITLLFADVLFLGAGFFIRDLVQYYWPTKYVIRETILAGHLPLWNPFYASGQPMAANPEYEVFYPLQALILLPDYDFGFQAHILVHLYVAAFGAFALLRGLGRGITAAVFAALTFSLGGPMLSLINLLPMMFCLAWIPWILLAVHRLAERPSPRRLAVASLVMGVQMLAFEPASLLQTWSLVGLYIVWRLVTGRPVPLLPMAGVFAGGVCIGAAQVLPAFDHLRDSVRATGIQFETAALWSMSPLRLIELVVPGFLGPLTDHGLWYWGSAVAYPKDGAPFLLSVYGGALLIPLLVAGIRIRPRGFWVGCVWAVAAVLLALGSYTPLFGWARALPLLGMLRYPEKSFLTFALLTIFYAAITLDSLVRGDETIRKWTLGTAAIIAAAAGVLALASRGDGYSDRFISFWRLQANPLAARMAEISRSVWLGPVVACAAIAILMALMRRIDPRIWGLLVIGVVAAELSYLAGEIAPRMPQRYFERPAAAHMLSTGTGRFFHEAQRDTRSEDAVRYTRLGDESYWTARNALLPMTPARWGIPLALDVDYDSTFLRPTAEFFDVINAVAARRPEWREIFGAMSNVTTRAVYRPYEEAFAAAQGNVEEMIPIRIIPMAGNGGHYFADEVVTARSPADVIKGLQSKSWSRRVAFWPAETFRPAEGSILRAEERPNRKALEVDAKGPAVLVSSTTFHRYWRATIDGAATTIHRTNVAYQSVRVPAGRHRIVFTYRNDIVLIGLAISCTALIAALVLMLRS